MWLVGNKITYVVHTCGLHSVSMGQLWPKPPLTKKPSAYEELRWQSSSGLILKRKKKKEDRKMRKQVFCFFFTFYFILFFNFTIFYWFCHISK